MTTIRMLDRWVIKRYCVTFTDNWTTTRAFWTLRGAIQCSEKHPGYSHVHKWQNGQWIEIR